MKENMKTGEQEFRDFGRQKRVLKCGVGGSARPGLNPSFGRILLEGTTSFTVLNTPMTHQGGLADLKAYASAADPSFRRVD